MAAEMLAAARRFRVANQLACSVEAQLSVAGERRQIGPVGRHKLQAVQRNQRTAAVRHGRQLLLEFAADDRLNAERTQVTLIERCIQAEAAEMRPRVEALDLRDHRNCEPGRGVHRQVERHHTRLANGCFRKTIDRQVGTHNLVSRALQPCCGRGKAERLPAEFVSGDENYQYTKVSSVQISMMGGPPVEILTACAMTSLPPSDSAALLRSSSVEKWTSARRKAETLP